MPINEELLNRIRENDPTLLTIHINNPTSKDLKGLIKALVSNHTITSIIFQGNGNSNSTSNYIDSENSLLLAKVLTQLPLTTLIFRDRCLLYPFYSLSYHSFNNKTYYHGLRNLIMSLPNLSTLETFEMSNIRLGNTLQTLFTKAFPTMSTLTSLNFNGCYFDECELWERNGFRNMIKALFKLPRLTVLNLSQPGTVAEDTYRYLLDFFPAIPSLTSLNLQDHYITDNEIPTLLKVLHQSPKLRELNLEGNSFTKKAKEFIEALPQFLSLRVFKFSILIDSSNSNASMYLKEKLAALLRALPDTDIVEFDSKLQFREYPRQKEREEFLMEEYRIYYNKIQEIIKLNKIRLASKNSLHESKTMIVPTLETPIISEMKESKEPIVSVLDVSRSRTSYSFFLDELIYSNTFDNPLMPGVSELKPVKSIENFLLRYGLDVDEILLLRCKDRELDLAELFEFDQSKFEDFLIPITHFRRALLRQAIIDEQFISNYCKCEKNDTWKKQDDFVNFFKTRFILKYHHYLSSPPFNLYKDTDDFVLNFNPQVLKTSQWCTNFYSDCDYIHKKEKRLRNIAKRVKQLPEINEFLTDAETLVPVCKLSSSNSLELFCNRYDFDSNTTDQIKESGMSLDDLIHRIPVEEGIKILFAIDINSKSRFKLEHAISYERELEQYVSDNKCYWKNISNPKELFERNGLNEVYPLIKHLFEEEKKSSDEIMNPIYMERVMRRINDDLPRNPEKGLCSLMRTGNFFAREQLLREAEKTIKNNLTGKYLKKLL